MRKKALFTPILLTIALSACSWLNGAPPLAVADVNGLARAQNGLGVMDFVITSGLSGDKLPGAKIGLVDAGGGPFVYAEDPTGANLPMAAPLMGDVTLRRVTLAPKTPQGYNMASAQGALDPNQLGALGILSEKDLRARLDSGADRAVLIYFYNPDQPLALTGASLEAYTTPFPNVTVLKAGGEPEDATLGLVIVALERTAYDTWANINVDRFLAGRIGQPPETNLADDLTFDWAYPTYSLTPSQPSIDAGDASKITIEVGWRSTSPDPPAPWSFTLSADNEAISFDPIQVDLKQGDTPKTVTINIDRSKLPPGAYSALITFQPFSPTAGLIDQMGQKTITFRVVQQAPTPTPGPPLKSMAVTPENPKAGDTLRIDAQGFTPGEHVLISFTGPLHRQSDSLPQADALGSVSVQIDLSGVPPGEYELRMMGADSAITGTQAITVAERPADAVVNSPQLNVRLEPFADSPVLEVLASGDRLQIINTNYDDSWVKVVTPSGGRGWVQSRLLTINVDMKTIPWDSNYPAPK